MKFMNHKIELILFFLIVFSTNIFAEKNFIHKTKYFDIIYSKKSEASAALIAEYADSYADEISGNLNKKIYFRMPVYIASNTEELNGYFTFFPYPRIFLHDTVPEEGQLSNFNDVILKVFYHELTHAISMIYWLPILPISFLEGAAVSYESLDGIQGRLNDPLIYHHLMQGRVEKTSPSWQEASGSRDIQPGTFWAYLYGASFAKYIQDVYGMENYAKYWHSSFYIFPRGKTKNIFGKSLDILWNDFLESIYFPEDAIQPKNFLTEKNVSTFEITAANNRGFACFDFAKKEVRFFTPNGKSEKLFTSNVSLSNLSFSQDGNLLLVTDMVNTMHGIKHRLSIFNLTTRKFLKEEYFSIRNATFLEDNKICGIETDGQFSSLVLFDKNITKKVLFSAGSGKTYSTLYSPVFAGKNKIAFIAANGLDRDVLILDSESGEINKVDFGKKLFAIRYLQSNNFFESPTLTFSWAEKNMLYRSAIYDVKNNSVKILEKNISGGTFFPVVLNTEIPKDLYYVGLHARHNALYKISIDDFNSYNVMQLGITNNDGESDSPMKNESVDHLNGIKLQLSENKSKAPKVDLLQNNRYSYLRWLVVTLPIPYPVFTSNYSEMGLGIKNFGIDPTTFLSYEADTIFYFKPFFYSPNFTLTVDAEPVRFKINLHDLNKNFVYRSTGFNLQSGISIPLKNNYHKFLLSGGIAFDGFSLFPKNYSNAKTLYDFKYTDSILSEKIDIRYVYFKTNTKLLQQFFAKDTHGVSISVGGRHGFQFSNKSNAFIFETAINSILPVVPLRLNASTYIGYNAKFAPEFGSYTFSNSEFSIGSTAGLPIMTEYSKLKKYDNINSNKIKYGFGFDAELSFFRYEIQQGLPIGLLYFNRMNMSIGYKTILNFIDKTDVSNFIFYQSIYTRLTFRVNSLMDLGIEYTHPIEKDVKIGNFGFIANMKL